MRELTLCTLSRGDRAGETRWLSCILDIERQGIAFGCRYSISDDGEQFSIILSFATEADLTAARLLL